MLIEEITIKNLLSFGPKGVTLPMRPLNVLIGANGSGKSNFIDALRVLQAAPSDIWKPMDDGGGASSWLHQPVGLASQNTIARAAGVYAEIVFPPLLTKARYEVEFTLLPSHIAKRLPGDGKGTGIISRECLTEISSYESPSETQLFFRDLESAWVFNRNSPNQPSILSSTDDESGGRGRAMLSQLFGPLSEWMVKLSAASFSGISLYGFWQSGRYTALRVPQRRSGKSDCLLADFSNLTLVVSEIIADTEKKDCFIEAVTWLFDGVSDVRVEFVGDEYFQLVLLDRGRKVPASRMSDGTLRFLSLLAMLLHPSPPKLVCIEEPEIGLHPDLIVKVADLLKEASTRMQLVVTTHSDMLLDALSDTPESIVVCSKDDGETVMTRLDAEELAPYLETQTLSSLWNSGQLGGRRW